MDIFILYKEDFPWDVRVEKLAVSLKSFGHNVVIVARNLEGRSSDDEINGITIKRLPIVSSKNSLLRKLANLPLWFNPYWESTLKKAISQSSNYTIIVRDLPLVRTALRVAEPNHAKVIFDMAEVYPYMYASARQFSSRISLESLVKSPSVADRYENSVIHKLDHTLVMIEESQDRLLAKGVDPRRVTIVSNTPPLDKYKGSAHQHNGHTLRLVYVGFLTKLRGLDLLVRAASEYIYNGNPPESIKIDIVGKGSERESLIALVNELGLGSSVTIHGWLDRDEVDLLMAQANVGVLTYRVCPHWNHTIPNKIFDYMLAGIPVLTTEVVPIKRIISETNSGLVCSDQDIFDIANNLEKLRSPELRARLGSNGIAAIRAKYNWGVDERRLHSVIESLE